MGRAQQKAVAKFRKRLKQQRMARLEVHVRKDDTALAAGGTSVEKLTCELSYRHQNYFRSPKGPATAKIHRMTLVTRNTDDIADLDVSILNPFELR